MTMILWKWQKHLSHFILYHIQLCIDLTHQVSSGYTWRSYCTLPGSRSRTWREKSYNFLPCWPEVGETRVIRSGVGNPNLGLASWPGWDLVSRHSVTRPGVLDHGCLWEPGCPTCVDVEHLRASWRPCPLPSWTSCTTCPPPSWTRWKRCPPLSSSSPCPWSSAFYWPNPGHLWTAGLVAHGPNELPARKRFAS